MSRNSLIVFGSLILVLGMMLGGCSRLSQNEDGGQGGLSLNNSSPNQEVTPPPFQYNSYQYPQAANDPPPGYTFVQLGVKVDNPTPHVCTNDNDFDICNPPDSIWAGKFVQYHQNKTIKLDRNELKLKSGCVPYPVWITMTKPETNEPWVEFEPHGMVFDQANTVEVKLYYQDCVLPPGVQPQDLVIWYWNVEQGVYEFIGGVNNVNAQMITFNLNHFSRYVVAGPNQ